MPTITDYLETTIGNSVSVGVVKSTWVQLTNNSTAVAYVSAAATDTAGKFTVNNVPSGSYSVATGPSATGPWTATGDTNYLVAPTAADNTSTFPGLVTVPSLTDTGLTAASIPFADTGGLLATDATLTFNKATKVVGASALTVAGAATFTAGPLSFPAGSIALSAVSGAAPTASPTFTGTVTLPGTFVNGSASTIVGAVVGGVTDSVISLNDTWTIQPTAHDQVGVYLRTYGAISALPSPRILNTLGAGTAPQFTFTTPQGGDVLGAELTVLLQGAAAGGNLTGTLRGVYGHVDFTGVGNGASVANVWGARFDVGLSSSGSGYTITNAASVHAGTPAPGNIGTIVNGYGVFSDGRVGIGGTYAAPYILLDPTLANNRFATFDRDLDGQSIRVTRSSQGRYLDLTPSVNDTVQGLAAGHASISVTNDLLVATGGRLAFSHGQLGFFSGNVAAKQTVTGAKAGNAALASLLTALAAYGLVVDSST